MLCVINIKLTLQRGLAHGTLLKEAINLLFLEVEQFMEAQVEQYIDYLPQWLQNIIAEAGVDAALDITYYLTEPYIPQYWLDELRGNPFNYYIILTFSHRHIRRERCRMYEVLLISISNV